MPDPAVTDGTSTSTESSAQLTSRASASGWLLATALLSAGVLAGALALGEGAPQAVPTGLPDAGRLTGWGLPVVRLLVDFAAVTTVGLLLTGVFLLPSPEGRMAGLALRAIRAAGPVAAAWAVLCVGQLLLAVSDAFAVPLSGTFGGGLLNGFALESSTGRALLAQALLAALVAVSARFTLATREGVVLLAVAVAALAPPVLTGHSAAAGSHNLAVVSLLVHVVSVSAWVGGLLGLGWVAWRGSKRFPAALARFSVLAAWCLALVAVSGTLNAAVRLGEPSTLLSSSYGALVLAKAAALVALGALGWQHRRRSVIALTGPEGGEQASARPVRLAFVRLAALELTLMAVTMALAVALSRTPTPAVLSGPLDMAVELTGRALPEAPTPWRLVVSFYPDGLGLLIVGMGAALYLQGLRVLRHRGDRWPLGRTLAWFGGLVVLAWATCGGLGLYAHVLFSAHMVAHMILSMVVPVLLVLGAPLTLALRALPGARLPGEQGPRQLLLAVLHSRVSKVLTFPLTALALFVASLYALYFSSLFDTLMSSHLGHAAMELHFLAVGYLFFHVLIGIDPSPRRREPLVSFALLMAAFALHAFFAVALMAETRVLGQAYYSQLDRPYRTDLLADQYFAAQTSWALGELPLTLVMLAIFVQWFRGDQRRAASQERDEERRAAMTAVTASSGTTDSAAHAPLDEHEQYNAYLRRLADNERSTPRGR
jgi:putative copper resistance protein D